jgi:hypothetical protein
MMMNAHGAAPLSLLDLLNQTGNEFHLRIRLTTDKATNAKSEPSFLLVIDGSKSFTQIVAAEIVTKAEHVVRNLFILQQSDDYPTANTEIWPLTNVDLEARWQHAGKTYHALATQDPGHRDPLLLSGQIQADGRLAAFNSLFYCTVTKIFFHPPCPSCGRHLWLCSDDSLLQTFGLPPYSQSLSRYLYCPKCVPLSADARFYAFSRKHSDPDIVLDTKSLINQFGNLMVRDIDPQLKFPCTDCGERGTCYGVENLVDKRMVPYSFYPFFAFLFEADTLQAADFLMLLSGASLEALTKRSACHHWNGRLNALRAAQRRLITSTLSFFDAASDQGFLEILYLKLAFLEELMDCLLKVCSEEMDDGAFSIDRVWVRIPEQNSYLPALWNFNVHYLGFGADVTPSQHLFQNSPINRLYFLGNVWFFALLTNSRQDMRTVRLALERMLSQPTREPSDYGHLMLRNKDPAFAPENIFWDPPSQPISEPLRSLWENSLVLGMSLLSAAVNRESSWSEMDFRQSLKNLRQDLKNHLFRQASAKDHVPAEDLRISAILKSILLKWQKGEIPATLETNQGVDSEEIILLTQVHSRCNAASVSVEEPIPETVHLRADQLPTSATTQEDWKKDEHTRVSLPKGRQVQAIPPRDSSDRDEVILETVILRSDMIDTNQNLRGREPRLPPEIDIPKTVIISSGDASLIQHHPPPSVPCAPGGVDHPAPESDLSQTKVLAPELKPETGRAEEGFPETVIIRNKKKEP